MYLTSRNFSCCETETLPITQQPPIPSVPTVPGNRQAFPLLSPRIPVRKVPLMSRITQHLSFCAWLVSLSIMSSGFTTLGCVSESPSLVRQGHSSPHTLCVHPTLCVSTDGPILLPSFGYCDSGCYGQGCANTCAPFAFLWVMDKDLEVLTIWQCYGCIV